MVVALVDRDLREIANDLIKTQTDLREHVQPASIDLPISDEGYFVRASETPCRGERVREIIDRNLDEGGHNIDLSNGWVLQRGSVYLVRIGNVVEPLQFEIMASPKSSIGRVDLGVKLLCDGCEETDKIPVGYTGEVFAEIIANSFDTRIVAGLPLTQIMVRDSLHIPCERISLEGLVYSQSKESLPVKVMGENEFMLSLDLPNNDKIVGYEAVPTNEILDITLVGGNDPEEFFRPIYSRNGRLTLQEGRFYILSTKEGVMIPPHLSAEMIEFTARLREARAHYAGFFDPGFGYGRNGELRGTIGVLEVRPYTTSVIKDGQAICGMRMYKNKDIPQTLYGSAGNNYAKQTGPKLAKFFKDTA
ncbi:MAG: 2'-deoxycytidine 5'-triphosphate deaminase domain-containing protein [Nanoarchaeota archaeon]